MNDFPTENIRCDLPKAETCTWLLFPKSVILKHDTQTTSTVLSLCSCRADKRTTFSSVSWVCLSVLQQCMDVSALIPHEPYSEGNLELTSFTKHFQHILIMFSIYQACVCQSHLSFHPTYHQMVINWQSLPELPEQAPQASLHGPRAWMDTWEPSAGHVNFFFYKTWHYIFMKVCGWCRSKTYFMWKSQRHLNWMTTDQPQWAFIILLFVLSWAVHRSRAQIQPPSHSKAKSTLPNSVTIKQIVFFLPEECTKCLQ